MATEKRIDRGRAANTQKEAASSQPVSPAARAERERDIALQREDESYGQDRPLPIFGLLRRSLLDDDFWSGGVLGESLWSPQIETFQRGDKLVVRADLPGLKRDDIDVDVGDGILTISGERKHESEEERDGYWRSERSYGRFMRSIPLPDGVDEKHIDASFTDGVLEIEMRAPKQQEHKSKRIKVR